MKPIARLASMITGLVVLLAFIHNTIDSKRPTGSRVGAASAQTSEQGTAANAYLTGGKAIRLWKSAQALQEGREAPELVSCVVPSGTRAEVDRVPGSWLWEARVTQGPQKGCRGFIRPTEFALESESRIVGEHSAIRVEGKQPKPDTAPAAPEPARAATATNCTTFDVPGANVTAPRSINDHGVIAGFYGDRSVWDVWHGFVRAAGGAITTFDPPGSASTEPASINDAGVITGWYKDVNLKRAGFIRTAEGAIATFGAPGSGIMPMSINNKGTITGTSGRHGFVRSAEGTITTFDPPGSWATYAMAINDVGTITGSYENYDPRKPTPPGGATHGFVRAARGAITLFDPPGSVTWPVSINNAGTIAGTYDSLPYRGNAFLRAADGTIVTFHVPGSIFPIDMSINDAGTVAGHYEDRRGVNHGFVRVGTGVLTTFDPPGSVRTGVRDINNEGTITGTYHDASHVQHGYLCNP